MAKLYIALESFDTTVGGELAAVKGGVTIVREGHALLKGRGHLFRELEADYEVEKATAEPGEKRTTTSKSTPAVKSTTPVKSTPTSKK